jgi:hypothetical protein
LPMGFFCGFRIPDTAYRPAVVRVSLPKGNLDEDVPTGHVRWSRDEAQATSNVACDAARRTT